MKQLVARLHEELGVRGIAFRPAVYLSDEWGCPDGTPLIGVPFYLADQRLERIEAEHSGSVESDEEAMRYLRHEAGHAVNYAFRLHERADFAWTVGNYALPYREHYRADPLPRAHVRHILGWYAQKHPDEDFAETFAVWLTPGLDWRRAYAGWPALAKLEWVASEMCRVAAQQPEIPALSADDLPVESMHWTIAEHYKEGDPLPLGDGRQFDDDLRRVFATRAEAPVGERAALFLERHEGEMVVRMSCWAGVAPASARALLRSLPGASGGVASPRYRAGGGDTDRAQCVRHGSTVALAVYACRRRAFSFSRHITSSCCMVQMRRSHPKIPCFHKSSRRFGRSATNPRALGWTPRSSR